MVFQFVPYSAVGELKFSMERMNVRRILGLPSKEFKKTTSSKNTTDDYGKLHIYYNSEDELEAIEFFGKNSEVFFQSQNLCELNFKEAAALLSREDDNIEFESDGLVSNQLGIALYAPEHQSNPSTAVETFLFFRKGYFD